MKKRVSNHYLTTADKMTRFA